MKYDVVVIGGSAAGVPAATTAKKMNKEKSVLVIRKEPESLIPCGIPYVFGTLNNTEDDINPTTNAKKVGVEFLIDEVSSVNTDSKLISTIGGETVEYDKLVFATGSQPFVPPIPGFDLNGVYRIGKEFDYIDSIREPLKKSKNVVIIGAGFIGVEMADELVKVVKDVTLIEAMDTILPLAFDPDMISPVQKELVNHGVDVRINVMVDKIIGEGGSVSGVVLKTGEEIKADAVIMAIGYRPNTVLAKESGLEIGQFGGIKTDEYLRTEVDGVFAVGDCAEHIDFFTRKVSRVMLASTAASEARVAALNLFKLRVIRQTKGSIAIFSSSIDTISMGAAGLTEKFAKIENFDYIVGEAGGMDHHPGKLPETYKQRVKLLFTSGTCVLIGAQIIGGKSTGEMINILGLAIQKGMTAAELSIIQYGTQPTLTAGPGAYPIVLASVDALSQMHQK